MKTRKPTYANVLSWIHDGHGQGRRMGYRPFYYVRDLSSQEMSWMVYCSITGRTHHYVGSLAFETHTLAAFRHETCDIREGFAALPWDETQEIARRLGLAHPIWRDTKVPQVLLTSLVISSIRADGIEETAISLIHSKELALNRLTSAKVTIVILDHYWKHRGIEHLVVTEKALPRVMAQNLIRFQAGVVNKSPDEVPVSIDEFVGRLKHLWGPHRPKNKLIREVCASLGLTAETGEAFLGRAVWQRRVELDLNLPIAPTLPLPLLIS